MFQARVKQVKRPCLLSEAFTAEVREEGVEQALQAEGNEVKVIWGFEAMVRSSGFEL